MKLKLATLAASALIAGSAFGTVSINFNASFEAGVPSGFANSAGVASNGLVWGLIIDSTGNGILPSYSAVPFTAGSSSLLQFDGSNTDDVFYISSTFTADTSADEEVPGPFTGGTGGIYDIVGIDLTTNGVNAGDKFYIVWFDGAVGGTLTDASFILPADGSAVILDAPFRGADPIRSAGLNYVGTGAQGTGAGVTFVPEPSAALLGAIGALGLLRRRRN